MTDYAGNMGGLSVMNTFNNKAPRKLVILKGQVTIGASGAVGAVAVEDNAITFTKNGGTGDYAITFPKCYAATFVVNLLSAANTVNGWNLKAKDAAAGTLNIITLAAGVAANPASGNVVEVTFFLEAE